MYTCALLSLPAADVRGAARAPHPSTAVRRAGHHSGASHAPRQQQHAQRGHHRQRRVALRADRPACVTASFVVAGVPGGEPGEQ